MNALWLYQIDKFVIDFVDQLIRLGVGGAIDIRPLILWHRREVLVPRQKIVTVRKGRNFGDKFNVMPPYPTGQIGNLFLFKKPPVSRILM